MPKVSIIVPIYNVEKYLDRCMQSLLNQTLKDIEIILVDDGSLDRCPQMCDDYATMDTRIRVIHKDNAGLGYARNSGLDIVSGEYVAFLDSDDYIDTGMYGDLYSYAKANDADAVFCGFYTETKSGKWRESCEVMDNTVWNGDEVREFMLDMIASAPYERKERRYQMSVWHSIYKVSVIGENNIRFLSEREVLSEDLPFQVDFLSSAKTVAYLKGAYYYYCLNGTSLTKTFHIDKYDKCKKLRACLLGRIDSNVARQRIDRLFIGYCRSFMYNLAASVTKGKTMVIRKIAMDDIWEYMRSAYPVSWLSLHSRICYWMMLHRLSRLALFYVMVTSVVRNKR